MQYHCVQCEERFSFDESGEIDARCPKCLRQHGLRVIDEKADVPSRRGVFVISAVVLAGLLGAGGYFAWQRAAVARLEGPVPLSPLSPDEIEARARKVGLDPSSWSSLLQPNAAIEAFARRATQGEGGAGEQAEAIAAAIAERASKQAFVSWSRTDTREGPVLAAAELMQVLARDGGQARLYPLELAIFAVAAARSAGLPAFVAEVHAYEGERAPLDPTGRFGYFALALLQAEGGATRVFDVYGGQKEPAKASEPVVLNDMQVLAFALSLRAMEALGPQGDLKRALQDVDAAIKWLPSSPTVRSARAAVLLASFGVEDARRELEAALQLRDDAPRRNNLATFALATQDVERATKEVSRALSLSPDFALGQLTLASVHLARGERELARASLERAEGLDAELSALPLAWAELHASASELTQALARAQEAVRRRPKQPESHLMLARIYRHVGRYDDMRRHARQVLELAAGTDPERVKKVVLSLLGPTALEPPSQPADAPDDTTNAHEPSEARAAEPGALQLRSPASRLRLGESDSRFELKLNP